MRATHAVAAVTFAAVLLACHCDAAEAQSVGDRLLAAAAAGSPGALEELLKSHPDADVNFRNGFGETALHLAGIKANPTVVEILLERGADVNAMSSGILEGHAQRVTRTPLMWMVYPTDAAEGVLALLEGGADPRLVSEEGTTALDMARKLEGKEDVVAAIEAALARRQGSLEL
jgi:ankyrin repeat protein